MKKEYVLRRFSFSYGICVFFLLNIQGRVTAQNSEYIVKAAFIERFTRFIEWPENDMTKPFVIVILGENPFGDILNENFSKIKIQNRPVQIRYVSALENTFSEDFHLLYVSSSKDWTPVLKEKLENSPILTIGESDALAKKGIMINFYTDDDKLKFEINEKAIKQSGLNVSYLLLNHARMVESK